MKPLFLMSPPRADWTVRTQSNFKSQKASASPKGAALAEWLALADAMTDAGAEILILPPVGPELTGLPYTAEAGLLVPGSIPPRYLLPKLTPAHRHAERDIVGNFVQDLGWSVEMCPVAWEGQGDTFFLGQDRVLHTYGEGPAARTSREAFAWAAPRIGGKALSLGFRADPWFHGNTWLGVFHSTEGDPALLVCWDALLPGEKEKLEAFCSGVFLETLPADASLGYATNALQVNGTVIAPPGLPERVTHFWKALGLAVIELELAHLFGRGGGAGVCLTNRLIGLDPALCPIDATYRHQRMLLLAER